MWIFIIFQCFCNSLLCPDLTCFSSFNPLGYIIPLFQFISQCSISSSLLDPDSLFLIYWMISAFQNKICISKYSKLTSKMRGNIQYLSFWVYTTSLEICCLSFAEIFIYLNRWIILHYINVPYFIIHLLMATTTRVVDQRGHIKP